jgi:hypothetical protein
MESKMNTEVGKSWRKTCTDLLMENISLKESNFTVLLFLATPLSLGNLGSLTPTLNNIGEEE